MVKSEVALHLKIILGSCFITLPSFMLVRTYKPTVFTVIAGAKKVGAKIVDVCTVLIKKSFLLYLTGCVVRHTITVLSTTCSKLPRKCSSNVTIILILPYFECYRRNIGHGRD